MAASKASADAPSFDGDLAAVRPTAESGDWANLPPRERQKIEAVRRKHLSERYKGIISDYHTRMAESKDRE